MAELEGRVRRLEERQQKLTQEVSDLKTELGVTVDAVKRFVTGAIDNAVRPMNEGLARLLLWTEAHDRDARARADVTKELVAQRDAELAGVAKLLAIQQQAADVGTKIDARISGPLARRTTILVAALALTGTLLAAIVAAVSSHFRKAP